MTYNNIGTFASDDFKRVAAKIYDEVIEKAARVVALGQEHMPLILIYDPDGVAAGIMPLSGLPDKDAWAMAHHSIADSGFISCFIMEAWVGPAMNAAQVEKYRKTGISHLPDKREAISVLIAHKKMGMSALSFISRPSNTLERGELKDDLEQGPMGERFTRDRPTKQ